MRSNNILIITHGFYPEQNPRSFRATELAKQFVREGHHVTVYAPFRKGVEEFSNINGIEYKTLGILKWKIFNFKSLGSIGKLYNKIVNRLLPLLFEFPMMELFFKVRDSLKRESCKYDLLISIAAPYPIHWGVASVWYKNKENIAKIWVADCGDPYCLQENDTFQPPFYFHYVEKWFMRKPDFITVPTKSSINGFFPEFQYKIRVIPQGFRFEEVEMSKSINDGIVRFGYGGGFIPGKRDPKEFIEFLVQLPKEFNFEFHIYTASSQLVEPFIKNDTRVIIHNPIQRLHFLKTISTFNFVVNFANKGITQTPSKLIDYAIIGKPILQVETGYLNKQNILAFLNRDYEGRFKIDNVDSYRIENVVDSFLKLKVQ